MAHYKYPNLWRDPFHSLGSIKILINCLFEEEDENFLTRYATKLTFELLDELPLHNYARFCTRFYIVNISDFQRLIKKAELDILQNRLVEFILDHSTNIREFSA